MKIIKLVFFLILITCLSKIFAQTSFNISNKTTGDTLFTIDENGKVGIGTTAPVAKLEVLSLDPDQNGSIRVGTSDLSNYLRLYSGRSTFPDPFIMWNEGSALRFGTSFADEYMRLTSEGNLGIGTTTPGYPLTIAPGLSERGLYIDHDQTGTASTRGIFVDLDRTGTGNGDATGVYSETTNNNGVYSTYGVWGNADGSAGGWKVGVYGVAGGTGSVFGLRGWTNPSDGTAYGVQGVANGSGSSSQYGVYGNAQGAGTGTHYGVYGTASGGGTHWAGYFNGNVYAGGNLGIGTSNPTEMLEVADTIYSSIGGFKFPDNTVQTTAAVSAVGGYTLDQAYDQGGPGAGGTIIADNGAVNILGTDGLLSTGTIGSGSIPVEGAGTRMMWYPAKAAFRAGHVYGTRWDDVNIGTNSFAVTSSEASGNLSVALGGTASAELAFSAVGGYASGEQSIAIGVASRAAGAFSTSVGNQCTTLVDYSCSFGTRSSSLQERSTSIGYQNTADGYGASAFGHGSGALADYSLAMGNVSYARGINATAIGNGADADGDNSISLGATATGEISFAVIGGNASGERSISLGVSSTASGAFSTSVGEQCITNGDNSSTFGNRSASYQQNSTTVGYASNTDGIGASAFGYQSSALNSYALAMGSSSIARGINATAIGYGADGDGEFSIALGATTTGDISFAAIGANVSGYQSIGMGVDTWVEGDYAVGVGKSCNAIGLNSLAIGYVANSLMESSTAVGPGAWANGIGATSVGYSNSAEGDYALAIGYSSSASGNYSTAIGPDVSISGAGSFISGDNSPTAFSRSGDNTFYARFANGYNLYTNDACTLGVSLGVGGTSWNTISDSTKKENFKSINGEDFLNKIKQFNLTSWNYKGQDPKQFRHYGPMAQDFYAAFGNDGIGTIGNDTTIASADFDGVNLIAIQALEKRTAENKEETKDLKIENQELRKEISALKSKIEKFESLFSKVEELTNQNKKQLTHNK